MTFEELHPELCPSQYCGTVNRYTRYAYIDDKETLVESWERDENGIMRDVLIRDLLMEKLNKATKEYEKLLNKTEEA